MTNPASVLLVSLLSKVGDSGSLRFGAILRGSLLIAMLAVIGGAERWPEVDLVGRQKQT